MWLMSWAAAAGWSSPAKARPGVGPVWIYRGLITIGFILIAAGPRGPLLWQTGYGVAQALAVLMIPGFLFAWWARLHLGRLWSGSVTRKEGHRIVDTGPYAWVRHPIYTGLLEAALLSAVAAGSLLAGIGFALFAAGLWRKARLEEQFLAVELGADYAAYRGRVPMLLPLPRPGSRAL